MENKINQNKTTKDSDGIVRFTNPPTEIKAPLKSEAKQEPKFDPKISPNPNLAAFQPSNISRNKSIKVLKWAALIVILLFLFIAVGAFGFNIYGKYYQKVAIESLLPKDASLVARITTDPNSKQFQLLEENFSKFPGYNLLKKEWDKTGKGKSATENIQDKMKEMGLDFEADIKPLLDEKVYIVIPDLNPLGENFKERILTLTSKAKTLAQNVDSETPLFSSLQLAQGENNDPKVLGEEDSNDIKPLNFIMASGIKDMKKAQSVMEKIKGSQDYDISQKNYLGYGYVSIRPKNTERGNDTDSNWSKLLRNGEIYCALLGSNWIVTSEENYVKDMITRKREAEPMAGLFLKDKSDSLLHDQKFASVNESLGQNGQDFFLSLYYNINYNDFFPRKNCPATSPSCDDMTQYFKYPENITSGFALRFDPDGIIIKQASNKISATNFPNKPVKESLASQVPIKVNERWADIYADNTNFKELYYAFKKNYLTDKGLDKMNEVLENIKTGTGIDLERDFIDLLNGNLAMILYTKKDDYPEGVVMAQISDKDKVLAFMTKLIEKIKEMQISAYEKKINQYTNSSSGYDSFSYAPLTYQQKVQIAKQKQEYQDMIEKLKNSNLNEKDLPEGKLYSYQNPSASNPPVPLPFSFSINFGLEDDKFILGTDSEVIESIMNEMKNSSGSKLAGDSNFQKASTYFFPETYSYTYINSIGLWNTVEFLFGVNEKSLESARQKVREASCASSQMSGQKLPAEECLSPDVNSRDNEEMQKIKDDVFAVGAIIRTLKLIGNSYSNDDKFVKNSLFLNIQSLSQEEKGRAEKILTTMLDENQSSYEKTHADSFKSRMSNLQIGMILCCDEEPASKLNATAGENICPSSKYSYYKLPTKDELNSSTDPVYTVISDCNSNNPTISVSNVKAGSCTGATISDSALSFSGC